MEVHKHTQNISKKWIKKLPFFYGWIVLFIAGIALFFSGPGQTYSFTLFIEQFITDFGWSRNAVSGMYTIATISSGIIMIFMGTLIDKFGAKTGVIIAGILLAIGCFFNSLVITLPMLLIGFFMNRFSGQGVLSLASGTFAPRWFVHKRGFAIMVVGLGGTFSGVVYPLLNNYLIRQYGWQNTFRILGISILLILIPLAAFFLVNRPEDLGMFPDNIDEKKNAELANIAILDDKNSLETNEAMKTFSFWVLMLSMFQFGLVNTGIAFHFVSIVNEKGFDQNFTAQMMSIGPIPGFATAIILGFIIDKIKKPMFLMGIAIFIESILIIALAMFNGKEVLLTRAIIQGVTGTIFGLCFNLMRPYLFGRRHIGSISGVLGVSGVIGSGFGPILFSWSFSATNSYQAILIVMGFITMAAGILCFFMKKPAKMLREHKM